MCERIPENDWAYYNAHDRIYNLAFAGLFYSISRSSIANQKLNLKKKQ